MICQLVRTLCRKHLHSHCRLASAHGMHWSSRLWWPSGWSTQFTPLPWTPKRGNIGIIAPIAIGFIVGANILAGGAFEGASMNPAVSFGPAVVSWSWDSHWVYWLGPFLGAGIAATVYEIFFIAPKHPRATALHRVLSATSPWVQSIWNDAQLSAIGF